jgi:hypothetical protein
MDEAFHAHCKLSPMWFLWESMHLRLVIVMVVMAHFSKKKIKNQKVGLYGFQMTRVIYPPHW